MHITHDETSFRAGSVARDSAHYTLIISNDSGATEQTSHSTKAAVRRQIRTWHAADMAAVVSIDGTEIYSGSALSF